MKMKKAFLYIALLSVSFVSCEIDNYDAPNAGIDGALIDVETGDTVYTEQPDGCKIRLMDLGYNDPTPLDFWVMANGHYRNVALFSGNYEVYPYQGPIFPMEAEKLTLSGLTKHDFKVTPYLKVKIVDYELSEGEIKVNYTIKRSTPPEGMSIGAKTISDLQILANTHPVVSVYNGGYGEGLVYKRVLSRTSDATLEANVQTSTLKGLTPGQKYYLRVAALSSCSYNQSLKRYNYSKMIEFIAE